MAEGSEHDVQALHEGESTLRTTTTKKPYITVGDRKKIADLLSQTRQLLVEMGKMDLKDATTEFRKIRDELEKRFKEEQEFIDQI